ncbi:MAG: T9SS type A sorting domain-containing protein [Bacteroidales bacterium]|nr:T9SS type A sorting domain-containing protein [Bacteroidales bacterium]
MLIALSQCGGLMAQQVSYRCGFETLGEAFGWMMENGSEPNRWCIGTGASRNGSYGLYVSGTSGRDNSYVSDSSIVYAYYDFTTQGGICNVSFDYGLCGYQFSDCMLAYLAPVPQTPLVAGRFPNDWSLDSGPLPTPPNEWIDLWRGEINFAETRQDTGAIDWRHADKECNIAGGSYRLIFIWLNNADTAARWAACVDNVSIEVHNCQRPGTITFDSITDTSCRVSWARQGTARHWIVEYGEGSLETDTGTVVRTSTPHITIAGLGGDTRYTVCVRSECSSVTSMSVCDTFHTICSPLTSSDLPFIASFGDGVTGIPGGSLVSCCTLNRRLRPNTDSATFRHGFIKMESSQSLRLPRYNGDLSQLMLTFKALNDNFLEEGIIAVGVIDNYHNLNSFRHIATLSIDANDREWHTFRVGFSGYHGSGYVVIKSGNTNYIDDVVLEVVPECPPVTQLRAAKLGTTSALLTWDMMPGAGIAADYYHITCEDSHQSNTVTTTDMHLLLDSLQPGEDYLVQITPDCNGLYGPVDTVMLKPLCLRGGKTEWDDGAIVAWVSNVPSVPIHPGWDNSITQTIYTRDELYHMGVAPGNLYACAFRWYPYIFAVMPYPRGKIISIYLDTTSRMAYQGSADNRRWIPIDTTKRYCKKTHRWDAMGEERFDFSTPFYWDGQSNIVMSVMMAEPTMAAGTITRFYSPYVPMRDTVSLVVFRDSLRYGENINPDTCRGRRSRLSIRPDIVFYGDCDSAGICGKPVLYVDSAFATTVLVRWSHGTGETAWRLEHCDTSGVWIVDDSATTAQRHLYTGLNADVEYRFRITALCDDSTHRRRSDTVTVKTSCHPAGLPLHENFETWRQGNSHAQFQDCWHRYDDVHDPGRHYIYVSSRQTLSGHAYSGNQSLCLSSPRLNMSYLVLPAVDADVSELHLSFNLLRIDTLFAMAKRGGAKSLAEVMVGVMSDPDNYATFTPVQTVSVTRVGEWEQIDVPFSSYIGSGHYVALATPRQGAIEAYIDDIELDYYNPCPRHKRLKVTELTSNSVTLKWLNGQGGGTALVEYGPGGFAPGNGTTLQTTADSITIAGLTTGTTYDFYVRRLCGTGDTSRLTGPVSAITGEWHMHTSATDTLRICDVMLYDDGGPSLDYSFLQHSTLTLLPLANGTYVSLSGTGKVHAYIDSMAIYDGMSTADSCIFHSNSRSDFNVGPFTATNPNGALTISFVSDGLYHSYGFELHATCLDTMPPACPAPTGLAVGDTTWATATLRWSDTGLFDYRFKAAGSTAWPLPRRDTATAYYEQGLRSVTAYEWQVRRVCRHNLSDWATATFTTPEAPCRRPGDPTVTDTGTHSATVHWQAYDGESRWQLLQMGYVRKDTVVGRPPATLSGLAANANYCVALRLICDDSSVSEWSDTVCFSTLPDTNSGLIAPETENDRLTMLVYPNPANSNADATVVVTGACGDVQLSLFSVTGQALRRFSKHCQDGCTMQFNLDGVPRGTYFIKVNTENKTAVGKLVVM